MELVSFVHVMMMMMALVLLFYSVLLLLLFVLPFYTAIYSIAKLLQAQGWACQTSSMHDHPLTACSPTKHRTTTKLLKTRWDSQFTQDLEDGWCTMEAGETVFEAWLKRDYICTTPSRSRDLQIMALKKALSLDIRGELAI